LSPEVRHELAVGRRHLADAKSIAGLKISYAAAREAYLAAFHAAQALLLERKGRAAKTHRGLRADFARLVRDETSLDAAFSSFLANAYELKSVADYGIEPEVITTEAAAAAIAHAERMVEAITTLLDQSYSKEQK
jgi:uncharacterized protein (UPF0332 family)